MEKKNIFLRRRRKTAKENEENISRRKKCCGTDGWTGMEGSIRGPWGPKITAEQKTTEPIILQKEMVHLVGLSILLRQQPEVLPFLSLIFEEAPSDINILKIKSSLVRSVSAKDMEIVMICQSIPN